MVSFTQMSFLFTQVTIAASVDGGFLRGPASNSEDDFREAMGTVMGCGGHIESERLEAVAAGLRPMWEVIPKLQNNAVDWKMVRYIAHRYFVQKSNLLVRGFEPVRRIDAVSLDAVRILSSNLPSAVEKSVFTKHSSGGFSFDDTVSMVATLEQLISNDENMLLQTVFEHQGRKHDQLLSRGELLAVVEDYMMHWMMDDPKILRAFRRDPTLIPRAIPKWGEIQLFVDGLVEGLEFERKKTARPGDLQGILSKEYSFEDAHDVASRITNTFASFWEGECQLIKQSLVAFDYTGSGRVRLSDFYGANADGEWRFGESEAYLRELGALDESLSWKGKQVIIPNYLQGANNCIVSTPHYLVCCAQECEEVLNEIENAAGAAFASPHGILEVVLNMNGTTDERPKIETAMRIQLARISDTHGGQVPLHGRLFAQWLHYVFPRECPFPHKTGTTAVRTATQFGNASIASHKEVKMHASGRGVNSSFEVEYDEAQALLQWSEEEELMTDYHYQPRLEWGRSCVFLVVSSVLALPVVVSGATKYDLPSIFSNIGRFVDGEQKSHLV